MIGAFATVAGKCRSRRAACAMSIAALTILPLAACSTSGGNAAGSGGADSSQGDSNQVVKSAQLTEFSNDIKAGEKVPDFTPPGEAIPNPESLRGAKIMVIPVTSKIAVCEQVGKQLEAFAPQMGMTAKTWDNSGQPSEWASGIQAAVQGGYKAIIFACGVNPVSVQPQLEEAKKAGITIVTSNGGDRTTKTVNPLLYGITTSDQVHYQQVNVEAAFVQSKGAPHHALIVTSNENVQAPPIVKAIEGKYDEVCGSDCKVTEINVPIPDWSTKIQSSVQAALVADPDVTAIYCIYAGQAPFAMPAVQAAHRDGVKIYTYGGDTGPLKAEQSGDVIAVNWAASPAWSAYQAYYQTFRGMTGQPALSPDKANPPYRAITPANVGEYFSGSGGYGTDFVNGFRQLFGLPPLAGAELDQAALAGR